MIEFLIGVILFGQLLFWLGLKAEWTRKFTHFVSGVSLIVLPYIWRFEFALFVGIVFTLAFIFIDRRNMLKSLAISRPGIGASLFPLGVTAAVLIGWSKPLSFQTAVLVLSMSDTTAWLFGRGYEGKVRAKKVSVSLLFGLVTYAIWILIGYSIQLLNLQFALATLIFSVVLTVVEYKSVLGSDNLFIPMLVAAMGIIVY